MHNLYALHAGYDPRLLPFNSFLLYKRLGKAQNKSTHIALAKLGFRSHGIFLKQKAQGDAEMLDQMTHNTPSSTADGT